MRQVSAVVKRHAHDAVSGFQCGEVCGHICLRPAVGLDIGVFGPFKQLFGALDGE